MYYFFQPLLDEEGKQVVRVPEKHEWYIDPYGEPTEMWLDMKEEIKKRTIGADDKYPILTLQKFEEDPFKEIRKVYEDRKNWDEIDIFDNPITCCFLWEAIVKTMERLEGK